MDKSSVFNTIKNVAGYGVGTLAALDTIKGGGLGSYLMNRQRLMSDPGFRASLEGSPFSAGVFGVSGTTGPAPAPPPPGAYPATAAGGGVVQPADMVGPPPPGTQVAQPGMPVPSAQTVPGYEPGTPRAWAPNLTPYDPEQAAKQLGFATSQIGLGSPDPSVVAQSKMAAGIPLSPTEMHAAIKTGTQVQQELGPGGVVKLDIPGMNATIGSPYNFAAMGNEEYPTPQVAMAAAAARNASIPPGSPQWTVVPSGRGTYLLAPPASSAQVAPPPRPPNTAAQPVQPAAQPTPPTQPAQPVPVQPAQPAATAPPPPPPPPPQPPPPASSPFDRDAIVPHTVVPDARTGNPPPAFDAGSPSGAFLDQAAPTAPVAAAGGRVDLNSSWLRELEAARPHLAAVPGVLSAMAEKESGGNALRVAQDPNSSAAGLFQINAPTAQAWGLSPADRFDPVKAATATADVLERRAAQVGIERAVGMHYGGQGTPYTQVVGSSGLSPAGYSGDVFARAQKYATAPAVGYPSPAFAEAPAAAQLTVPVVPKPPVIQPPPPQTLPPPAAASAGPTVLTGPADYPAARQMPMTGETRRTSEGEQTFHAPDTSNADTRVALTWNGITNIETTTPQKIWGLWQTQRYLDQQRQMDHAEIERTQKAVLEGDGAGLASLMQAKVNVNRLLTDFPDPNQRAQYLGTLRYPTDMLRQAVSADPMIAKFHNDVAALGVPLEGSSWIGRKLGLPSGSALLPGEQSALQSVLPSGMTEPAQFEDNLQTYRDTIDSSIGIRDFLRGRPQGSTSVGDINTFLTRYNDALTQRRLDALQPPQQGNVPPAPPPAAAPPPPPADTGAAAPWAPMTTWTVQ